MERKSFQLGDVVEMKKMHPCGTNAWKVIRMGMDIRTKCTGAVTVYCFRVLVLKNGMKRILVHGEAEAE